MSTKTKQKTSTDKAYFYLFILPVCFFISITVSAQENSIPCQQAFNSKIEKTEYGSYVLQIRPYAKAPCGYPVSDMEDMYKLWGVLICYTVNGEQEVKRQDMTYDIKKEGFYQTYLSYSDDSPVSDLQLFYFDASKDPSTYPEKSCSFFNKR